MRVTSRVRSGLGAVLAIFLVLATPGIGNLFLEHVFAVGLSVAKLVSAHAGSGTTVTTTGFTTSQGSELLVAFAASDGPNGGKATFTAMTTTGLTWRLRQPTNAQNGTAEIWTAVAANVLTNATVKGTHTSGSASLTVATFTGANTSVDGATST